MDKIKAEDEGGKQKSGGGGDGTATATTTAKNEKAGTVKKEKVTYDMPGQTRPTPPEVLHIYSSTQIRTQVC